MALSRVIIWSSMACLLSLSTLSAQTTPRLAQVKVGSVLIRSGPSEQMPATGMLESGMRVIVDHEEGESWLAIEPPRGSLSWVNHRYLEPQRKPDDPPGELRPPYNAIIRSESEVLLRAGMIGENKPLKVQRTKVPEGTIVRVIGPKIHAQADGDDIESYWYPIEPPQGDFRYIPKATVEITGTPSKPIVVVQSEKPGESNSSPPTLAIGPRTPVTNGNSSDTPNHPLWRDAEQARVDGNFAQAEKLYKQLAEEATRANNTAIANLCFNRIHYIRELQRQQTPAQSTPPVSGIPTTRPKDDKTRPDAAIVNASGLLRAVRFEYLERKVYALTDNRGINVYLISDEVEFSRLLGKWVELSGTVSYPKEFGGVGLMMTTKLEKVEGGR